VIEVVEVVGRHQRNIEWVGALACKNKTECGAISIDLVLKPLAGSIMGIHRVVWLK
jgi:hypothetical protein